MLSDSDDENIQTLTINEHYAKAFEFKKEREELAKLKEKYGSDFENEETDSEDAESEDEHGEELTPAVDAAILRTLARIRRKDPAIYNLEESIFEEEQERTADRAPKVQRKTKVKSKPLTIRQAALASALEANTSRSPTPEPHIPTHTEEQRQLRDETRAAFHTAVDEGDDDALLVPREKTQDEVQHEEEEYRDYLKREVGEDLEGLVVENSVLGVGNRESEEGTSGKKKSKKQKNGDEAKGKADKEADQEFLVNYILNRGWIDKSARRLPTYKEIVKSKSRKGKAKDSVTASEESANGEPGNVTDGEKSADDDIMEDDDDFEEIADAFESSYNFRFEEPDAATIKTFPRTIASTVRRADTARKEGRERRKQRQEEELAKKREEVRRMKALKMKEVRRKLERIGREGGVGIDPNAEAFEEFDLDGDWDPDAHDKQMAGLYGAGDHSDVDEEKPVWDDDIDVDDVIPPSQRAESLKQSKKKKNKRKKAKDSEDEWGVDVNAMDADAVRTQDDEEEWDGTEGMRKRKLDEYMDEVYGLEFNDMVAGMPTRFKYNTSLPQTFALTPAEVLMATDQELNQYVSVKRYAPYRAEKWDHNRGERLKEFREKLKERVGGTATSGRDEDATPKKRLGRKERQKLKAAVVAVEGGDMNEREVSSKERKTISEDPEDGNKEPAEGGPPKKKRRRKHKTGARVECQ